MPSEFELIERFFNDARRRADVVKGVGDDGAVLRPPAGQELVVTVDTLIENVHFPVNTDAGSIGHKALAVNLSDLAAMGAQPAWVLLALTLPQPDEKWLQEFARGFFELASRYNVQLVGGDTTRGSLS
ncbi:MAG: thiamine-phosphate kinase, partial [Gammaproteobacteria bacterium]